MEGNAPTRAEVPDWPFSGLTLLVIEASSQSSLDLAVVFEKIDTPGQDGHEHAAEGLGSAQPFCLWPEQYEERLN